MRADSWLAVTLAALAGGLAVNSILGPLGSEVIEYRYSESIRNQAIALDAVSLLVAVPLTLAAAVLIRTGRRSGPVVALAPASYALYMMPQYVVGPEYGVIEGNNEHFFALHFALFIVAGLALVLAVRVLAREQLVVSSGRRRAAIGFLFGFPVFLVAGMYGRSLADALSAHPERDVYLDNPTAFWVVAFLDLAVMAPIAVASGIALLHRASWAMPGVLVVVGWFALVPLSVASMAVVMLANDDPAASSADAVAFGVFAVVFVAFAGWLSWPLLRADHPARYAATGGAVHAGK